jgi:hypothetical protein
MGGSLNSEWVFYYYKNKIRAGGYQQQHQKSNTHHPNTGKEDGAKKFHCQRSSMLSCRVCSHNYGHNTNNNNKLSYSAVSKENFVKREAKNCQVSREN